MLSLRGGTFLCRRATRLPLPFVGSPTVSLQTGALRIQRPQPFRHYASEKQKPPRPPKFIVPSRRAPPPIPPDEELIPYARRILKHGDVSQSLRAVMRHMVHPVVIVTSSTSADPQTWRAITLSSFNSLSLTPNPLVSFNIKLPSEASRTMHKRGAFVVHTMLPTNRSADFAARFSQPYVQGENWKYTTRADYEDYDPIMSELSEEEAEELLQDNALSVEERLAVRTFNMSDPTVLKHGQFSDVPVVADPRTDNIPVLTEEVMFRLHCVSEKVIPVQDHEIWIAKVKRIEYPGEWPNKHKYYGVEEDDTPLSLLYGNHRFRESGLVLIERNNKVRRWFRRKLEFERAAKEASAKKLAARLARQKKRAESFTKSFRPPEPVDVDDEPDKALAASRAMAPNVHREKEVFLEEAMDTEHKRLIQRLQAAQEAEAERDVDEAIDHEVMLDEAARFPPIPVPRPITKYKPEKTPPKVKNWKAKVIKKRAKQSWAAGNGAAGRDGAAGRAAPDGRAAPAGRAGPDGRAGPVIHHVSGEKHWMGRGSSAAKYGRR